MLRASGAVQTDAERCPVVGIMPWFWQAAECARDVRDGLRPMSTVDVRSWAAAEYVEAALRRHGEAHAAEARAAEERIAKLVGG